MPYPFGYGSFRNITMTQNTHRFFAFNRSTTDIKPVEIFETDEDTVPTLSNHVIWKIDLNLFPIKDETEIKSYFKDLTEKPENTFILPGFDTIRTT